MKQINVPLCYMLAALLALSLSSCTHMVSIQSVPEGARVSDPVRGDLGTTSARPIVVRNVASGSRLDLYVSKNGYEPQVITLNNIRGNHDVLAILRDPATKLWIGSVPPGARVAFYDIQNQRLPIRSTSFTHNAGDFANQTYLLPRDLTQLIVTLDKPGYETLRRRIRVQPGKENRQSFTLTPRHTLISIETEPNGAEVFERRLNILGTTPIHDLNLSYERLRRLHADPKHTLNLILTISKHGYRSAEIIHRINLFQTNPLLSVELEPETFE